MIVSNTKRFVFTHVPKTGGTSLSLMLAPFSTRVPERTRGRGWQAQTHEGGQHGRLTPDFRRTHGGKLHFTVIRNPYDRFLSMWRSGYRNACGMTPESFARLPSTENQISWFVHDGKILVDRMLRYESYEAEVRDLLNDLDIEQPQEIPHRLNTAGRPRDIPLTRQLADIIYENFQQDFYMLGYEKGSWKQWEAE